MQVTDQILGSGEYYPEVFPKTTFYLHHTAGGHRPDWVISTWDTDDHVDATGKTTPRAVATPFVIGGISTSNGDATFDGKIYRAYDEKYWCHHLGTTYANNKQLNKESIAVEICNYGPLTVGKDGNYYNYVMKQVPADMVIKLDKPFKGFVYYHKYTDKQIAAVRELILEMNKQFPTILLKTPLVNAEAFELNDSAKAGKSGIYTHVNVRSDKFDCFPQPNLISMLKSICP